MCIPVRAAPLAALLALAAAPVAAQTVFQQLQDPKAASVQVVGHVVEPRRLEPTAERMARVRVPAGFQLSVWARDVGNARMLAVRGDGTVYLTRRATGDVLMLRDADGDGTAEQRRVVASRPNLHGIAIRGDTAWLVAVRELFRAPIRDDGSFGTPERIVRDFPDAGQHPNRTIAFGPDGMLYLSVGSTCNACGESSPESATMLRVRPDGSGRTIFATGLRNTIGFGWHPETRELWGMDHGIDWLGDNEQHEELNRIVEGAKYGWPYVYADGKPNPQDYPPAGITMAEWAARSAEPQGLYVPHSAPMQMAFYTGSQFPAEYRGDAFVAMRGSWNRREPSGYEVMRIRFDGGRPAGMEPFVQGFLQRDGEGWGYLGRLVGMAQARDGSLLFTDDEHGIIYRLAYVGGATAGGTPGAPTNAEGSNVRLTGAPSPAPPADTPDRLARDILGRAAAALRVTSPAIRDGAPIPDRFAAEGDNVSPPLSWGAGPAGTRSYALLMEDPDVASDPPFVHWLLYNLPDSVTSLPEGLPGTPQLTAPEGAKQGRNERGSTGYFGPRPPVGDPAHRYHFQLFALDRVLELPHGASRAELLAAMQGHVLAQGTLVGTYRRR